MRSHAAAMLLADYRSMGAPDLVCVSDHGEGKLLVSKVRSSESGLKVLEDFK